LPRTSFLPSIVSQLPISDGEDAVDGKRREGRSEFLENSPRSAGDFHIGTLNLISCFH